MPWIDACALDDIDPEDVIRFDHGTRTFAIYRTEDDEVFCSDGLCTHEQVHLADGLMMDYVIECPRHNGRFDVRNGKPLGAPVCVALSTYPARIDGDRIVVDLPD
jgi:3-phenylpropionate/trans-cinnamate dioxygenase ferredoxin subunit